MGWCKRGRVPDTGVEVGCRRRRRSHPGAGMEPRHKRRHDELRRRRQRAHDELRRPGRRRRKDRLRQRESSTPHLSPFRYHAQNHKSTDKHRSPRGTPTAPRPSTPPPLAATAAAPQPSAPPRRPPRAASTPTRPARGPRGGTPPTPRTSPAGGRPTAAPRRMAAAPRTTGPRRTRPRPGRRLAVSRIRRGRAAGAMTGMRIECRVF